MKLKLSIKKIGVILLFMIIAAAALIIYLNHTNQFKAANGTAEPEQVDKFNSNIGDLKEQTPDVSPSSDSGYIDDEYSTMISNGAVVILDKHIEGNKFIQEVYNTANLDKFIENFNSGKQDKIRIVKYNFESARVWVNKLMELECKDNTLKLVDYKINSNKNTYEKSGEKNFAKITKQVIDGEIRYALHETKDSTDSTGVTILSFNKNSLKK